MNTLQLKLRNQASFRPIVKIDDKEIKLKKNEFGSMVGNYSTDKNKVNLKIYTLPHEFESKYWFLIYLLYQFENIQYYLNYYIYNLTHQIFCLYNLYY